MRNEYRIKVFEDGSYLYRIYRVEAHTEEDARSIAFLLDGGSNRVPHWDTGHIQLAFTWTEVIK